MYVYTLVYTTLLSTKDCRVLGSFFGQLTFCYQDFVPPTILHKVHICLWWQLAIRFTTSYTYLHAPPLLEICSKSHVCMYLSMYYLVKCFGMWSLTEYFLAIDLLEKGQKKIHKLKDQIIRVIPFSANSIYFSFHFLLSLILAHSIFCSFLFLVFPFSAYSFF